MSEEKNQTIYDVALSFAGEDRKYAQELATELTYHGIKVFYDAFEQSDLWGKNLYTYLAEIYSKRAEYCVMFLSENYARKLWTSHERESAQAKAFSENKTYILPVRIDDTEIPGIFSTIAYLDLRQLDIKQIAQLLLQKLGKSIPPNNQNNSSLLHTACPTLLIDESKNLLHQDEELMVIAAEMRHNVRTNIEPPFILSFSWLKSLEDELSVLKIKTTPSLGDRKRIVELKSHLLRLADFNAKITRGIKILLEMKSWGLQFDENLVNAIKAFLYSWDIVKQQGLSMEVYREQKPEMSVKIYLSPEEVGKVVDCVKMPEISILSGVRLDVVDLPEDLLMFKIFPEIILKIVVWDLFNLSDAEIIRTIEPNLWYMAKA